MFVGFAVGALVALCVRRRHAGSGGARRQLERTKAGANGGDLQGVNNDVNVVGLPNLCNSPALGCITPKL